MPVFIGSFILTIIAAFIQTTNWILIGAIIKPNLILITLIILALANPNWPKRIILILTAALILKFAPGFTLLDLTFTSAAIFSIILLDILPWQQPVNLFLATLLGTITINLSNLSQSLFLPLIYEFVFNLFLVFALFALLKLIYVPQTKLQKNRF